MIIGLVGKKQVGKDTVANYLVQHYGFLKHAFAAPLKDACKILFLLEPRQMNDNRLKEKKDLRWGKSPREIMQLVGTDLFRDHVDVNFWVRHMEIWIDEHPNENIVVSDVRFQNEANLIKKKGGILWSIERNTLLNDDHKSETQKIDPVDNILFNNLGVTELYRQIDLSIKNLS